MLGDEAIALHSGCCVLLITFDPHEVDFIFAFIGYACANTNCVTPKTQASGVHWPPNAAATVYIDPKFTTAEQNAIKDAVNAWKSAGAFGSVTFTGTDPGPIPSNNTIRISQDQANGTLAEGSPTTQPTDPTTAVGGIIHFDPNFVSQYDILDSNGNVTQIYTYSPYIAGVSNGEYAFLTLMMEHEIGHVLGLADNHDSSGKEIDYPGPTAMGGYTGTNNNGFSITLSSGQQYTAAPGNAAGVTVCDKDAVVRAENSPPPIGGGGGQPPTLGEPGLGGGGYQNTCTQWITNYYEWDDDRGWVWTDSDESVTCDTSFN